MYALESRGEPEHVKRLERDKEKRTQIKVLEMKSTLFEIKNTLDVISRE